MAASLGKDSVRLGVVSLSWVLSSCRQGPIADCDFVPNDAKPIATLTVARRFEKDPAFRRSCLERSLVNRENGYSKVRLARYVEQDWGRLPVATFRSRPVLPSDIGKPVPSSDASWSSIPSGTFAATVEGLEQRGEQMFKYFPAQVELSMIPVLRRESGPAQYGLWRTAASVGGLVWVALPGGVYPALTCSSCHASVDETGELRAGVPNHDFDLGKAKDDFANMRTLYSTWGPGRVDIAADGRDNPIVIADVRAARYQRFLHRTANVKNSLLALSLRVETGLITAHYNAVRPEPSDAFALAYYLWSLGRAFEPKHALRHSGRRLFERHCATCHEGPSHAGKPVTPESIQSPVSGMPSPARGTGTLQTISLLGVKDRKRLLFGGEARGIEGLLDPERTEGGHYVGKSLTEPERQAMRAYLEAL